MDQVLDIARWTTEDPTVIAGMVNMLEQVVRAMMVGSDAERDMAQGVLTNLKDHMESWKCVANILDDKFTQDQPTKFFGLQILEEAIKYRWKVLPAEQREGIKGYVVELCIKMSQDEATLRNQKVYLSKLNLILVQILKQEWCATTLPAAGGRGGEISGREVWLLAVGCPGRGRIRGGGRPAGRQAAS